MLLWLNGPFGIGKSTIAELIARSLPNARIFDPHRVGEALVSTPQESWRNFGEQAAAQALDCAIGTLIVPQTVLEEQHWDEILAGLDEKVGLIHVVLHAEEQTLIRRIERGPAKSGSRWQLDRVGAYREALPWLRSRSQVVDTDQLSAEQVAALLANWFGVDTVFRTT